MPDEAICTGCGCSDSRACDGGCTWITVDYDAGTGLCSACLTPSGLAGSDDDTVRDHTGETFRIGEPALPEKAH